LFEAWSLIVNPEILTSFAKVSGLNGIKPEDVTRIAKKRELIDFNSWPRNLITLNFKRHTGVY